MIFFLLGGNGEWGMGNKDCLLTLTAAFVIIVYKIEVEFMLQLCALTSDSQLFITNCCINPWACIVA